MYLDALSLYIRIPECGTKVTSMQQGPPLQIMTIGCIVLSAWLQDAEKSN
jgi:hypothetical protein